MPLWVLRTLPVCSDIFTVEKFEAVFNALAESGKKSQCHSANRFLAKSFGMLIDCFGVAWILKGELNSDHCNYESTCVPGDLGPATHC